MPAVFCGGLARVRQRALSSPCSCFSMLFCCGCAPGRTNGRCRSAVVAGVDLGSSSRQSSLMLMLPVTGQGRRHELLPRACAYFVSTEDSTASAIPSRTPSPPPRKTTHPARNRDPPSHSGPFSLVCICWCFFPVQLASPHPTAGGVPRPGGCDPQGAARGGGTHRRHRLLLQRRRRRRRFWKAVWRATRPAATLHNQPPGR